MSGKGVPFDSLEVLLVDGVEANGTPRPFVLGDAKVMENTRETEYLLQDYHVEHGSDNRLN